MSCTRARVLVLLCTVSTASCDGDDLPVGVPPDANTILGIGDAGASPEAWPGTCDPVRQDCPTGQQCTGGCNVQGVMTKVFTCAVPALDAAATHGQDCGAGCARGHDCYVVPAAGGGMRSVCRKYCNTDADCPTASCVSEGLVCTAGDTAPIGRLCAL